MIFSFFFFFLKPISVNSFVKVTTISSMKTSRKYREHFQKQKRCVWIQPSDLHFKNIGAQGYLINESYGHQSARVATYLRTNFYPLSGMCWWSPVSLISRLPGPIDFILTICAVKKCPFSLAKTEFLVLGYCEEPLFCKINLCVPMDIIFIGHEWGITFRISRDAWKAEFLGPK